MKFLKQIKCSHLAKPLEFVKNSNDRDKSIWKCQDCRKIIYRSYLYDAGEVSDGYHTFNELYHHRTLLFASICNMFPEYAWKSQKHEDGTMYNGMFIAGIKTPYGDATYHSDIKYWNHFKIKELPNAPKFDGHTPEDAIRKIFDMAKEYKAIHNVKTIPMKTCMISLPMNGRSDEEIKYEMNKVKTFLENNYNYRVIDTFFEEFSEDNIKNKPLNYLSKSLEMMSKCDAVYFCKGWENARGCKIEHEVAKKYDLKILYEE